MMNNIFRESFKNFMVMYLIFSKGLEEHEKVYILSSINFREWVKCKIGKMHFPSLKGQVLWLHHL
jgi:hypothetical protein